MALKFLNSGYFAGKVGIGADDPLYQLQVQDRIHIEDTTSQQPKISFSENTNTSGEFVLEYNGAGGGAGNYVTFYSEVSGWVGKGGGFNYIPQNGYVGIGTTSPSEKLSVSGNILAQDSGVLAGINGDKDGFIFHDLYTGSGNYYGYKAFSGGNTRLSIVTDASERLTVLADGNVGIGTASPDAKLEVSGEIKISGGDYNGLYFENAAGTTKTLLYQHANYDALVIKDVVNNADRVTFKNNGNVGIGTTSPGNKLHVLSADNAAATNIARFSSNNNSVALAIGYNEIRQTADANPLYLGVHSGTAITIVDGGKVGIGTTSPSEKLTVHSTATAIQTLYTTNTQGGYTGYQNSTGGVKGFVGYGPTLFTGLDINNFGLRSQSGMPFATGGGNVRMYINSSGNVGVGTTSPGAKFTTSGVIMAIANDNAYNSGYFAKLSSDHGANSLRLTSRTGDVFLASDYGSSVTLQVGNPNVPALYINANKRVQFNGYDSTNQTGTPTYLLGTDSSGNIVKTNTIPGSGAGPYLPLTAGSSYPLTGALYVGAHLILQQDGGNDLIKSTGSVLYHKANEYSFQDNSNNSWVTIKSGNVGIGTTSPAFPLHVNTSNDVVGYFKSTDNKASIIIADNDTTGYISAENDRVSIGYGNGVSTSNITILNGSYNVGIGTTSPSQKLHVIGNAKVSGVLYSSILSNDNGVSQKFRSSAGSDLMTILEGGNVGIGTTSPGRKLSVNGSIELTGSDMTLNTTSAAIRRGTAGQMFLDAPGDVTVTIDSNSNNTDRVFNVRKDTGSELFRIQENGNVGIGTTSPGVKLDVTGEIRTSSNFIADNATLGSLSLRISGTETGRLDNFNSALRLINFHATSETAISGNADISLTSVGSNNIKLSTANTERMRIDSSGNVMIGNTGAGAKLDVRADTGYVFRTENASGNTFRIEASSGNIYTTGDLYIEDNNKIRLGASSDLQIYHDGINSYISEVGAGDLIISADNDLTFKDGSGNIMANMNASNSVELMFGNSKKFETTTFGSKVTGYLQVTSGVDVTGGNIDLVDNSRIRIGTSQDLQIYHDGSNSFIEDVGTGGLFLKSNGAGIYLKGFTSTDTYAQFLEGGSVNLYYDNSKKFETSNTGVSVTGQLTVTNGIEMTAGNFNAGDGERIRLGNSADFQIYHSGTHSFIDGSNGAGSLYIRPGSGGTIQLETTTGTDMIVGASSAVTLYSSGNSKLSTGAVSVGAATTTGGTLIDGWKTTTQANAINNTTIATTAYVNNLIGTIPAGLVFQGTWDAATNTPTLTSGSGTTGNFYIVSTSGSTNLDGVTDWVTGDWAVFIEQGGTDAWEKIDNSSVLDGAGTGQTVPLWSGSGTSNTLTDAPITVSGNNTTFAGNVTATSGIFSDVATLETKLNGNDSALNFTTASGDTFRIGLKDSDDTFRIAKSDASLATNTYLTINSSGNATFAGDVSLGGNLTLTTNARYLRAEDSAGTTTRLLGINSANTTYIGPIDAYAGGDIFYGVSAGVSNQVFYTGSTERMRITSTGNVGINKTNPGAKLDIQPTATDRKVTRIQNDVMSTYYYNSQVDAILAWTCGSYYQAEVVITANQTNGGDYNNIYIRGIWSNNHTSHHWDELERVGYLSGSTFTMSVGQNGATAASGRLELDFDYISQSFSEMNIRVTDFYGSHTYTIT